MNKVYQAAPNSPAIVPIVIPSSPPMEVSPLTPSPPAPPIPAFPPPDAPATIIHLTIAPPSSGSLAPQPTPTFPAMSPERKLHHSKSAPNLSLPPIPERQQQQQQQQQKHTKLQPSPPAPRLSPRRLAQRFLIQQHAAHHTHSSQLSRWYAHPAVQPPPPPNSDSRSPASSSLSSSSSYINTPSTRLQGTDTRLLQRHLQQQHHHLLPPSGAKSAR